MKKYIKNIRTWIIVSAMLIVNFSVLGSRAFAGTLTKTTVLELGGASNATPMIANTSQSFAIDFETSSAGATTASINFSNFTGGTVNSTQTVSSSGCTTYFPTATPLPGGSLLASGASNTVSITGITALSTSTEYCAILTSTTAVTNPASAGVYSALVTVGSDSQTAAFDVLSSGNNAYNVTATVVPSFTMSLSGATDALGTLSSSALTTSPGITVTTSTNGKSGYNLYAEDSNAGLISASASHTIATVSTGSNHTMNGAGIGSEGYALGVSANNTANYAYGAGTTGGGLSNTAFNQVATFGSAANATTQVFHELADISGTTPPGTDYTDTITLIGTGSF